MDFLLTKKFTESVHFNEKHLSVQHRSETQKKKQKKTCFLFRFKLFSLKTIDLTSTTTQFRYQATVAGRAWAMAVDAIGGSGNAGENDI